MGNEITPRRKAARQELALASCLGTSVVFLVQYLAMEKLSALMMASAACFAYAAPLLAWSFLNLYNQGELSPSQLVVARTTLFLFLVGIWLALLAIGWLPAAALGAAIGVMIVDDYVTERKLTEHAG